MMEPVVFPDHAVLPETPAYAVTGTAETRVNLVSSIYLEPDELEAHVRKLEAKYRRAEEEEVRCEWRSTDDTDIVLIGYGIVTRVLKSVVETGRALGMHLGLLRPVTLYRSQPCRLAKWRSMRWRWWWWS